MTCCKRTLNFRSNTLHVQDVLNRPDTAPEPAYLLSTITRLSGVTWSSQHHTDRTNTQWHSRLCKTYRFLGYCEGTETSLYECSVYYSAISVTGSAKCMDTMHCRKTCIVDNGMGKCSSFSYKFWSSQDTARIATHNEKRGVGRNGLCSSFINYSSIFSLAECRIEHPVEKYRYPLNTGLLSIWIQVYRQSQISRQICEADNRIKRSSYSRLHCQLRCMVGFVSLV